MSSGGLFVGLILGVRELKGCGGLVDLLFLLIGFN